MTSRTILMSLAGLTFIVAASVGATGAFFGDSETSTANVLMAGAIDLQVGSSGYYNGEHRDDLSWLQKDLETGELFFRFDDVKPGDWGENTISLHVENNDWWMCVDTTVASSSDVGSTEPELVDEIPYTPDVGELGDTIQFVWWVDDGDNVLEDDETIASLGAVGDVEGVSTTTVRVDSVVDHLASGPLHASQSYHLGVGWCAGALTLAPVEQDGLTDGSINNPTVASGFMCDGSAVDNRTQTDSLNLALMFRAEQVRHNESFSCTSTMTVSETFDQIPLSHSWDSWLPRNGYPYGSGNWRIENGTLTQDEGGDSFKYLLSEYTFSDQTAELLARYSANGYGGLTLWHTDIDNWVDVFLYPVGTPQLWVIESVDGVGTTTKYVYPAMNDVWYKVRVEANSVQGTMRILVDDELVVVHEVTTGHRSGRTGINSGNGGSEFDSFLIESR